MCVLPLSIITALLLFILSMCVLPLNHYGFETGFEDEEHGLGCAHADFANKYLGGGVLSGGCVQVEKEREGRRKGGREGGRARERERASDRACLLNGRGLA